MIRIVGPLVSGDSERNMWDILRPGLFRVAGCNLHVPLRAVLADWTIERSSPGEIERQRRIATRIITMMRCKLALPWNCKSTFRLPIAHHSKLFAQSSSIGSSSSIFPGICVQIANRIRQLLLASTATPTQLICFCGCHKHRPSQPSKPNKPHTTSTATISSTPFNKHLACPGKLVTRRPSPSVQELPPIRWQVYDPASKLKWKSVSSGFPFRFVFIAPRRRKGKRQAASARHLHISACIWTLILVAGESDQFLNGDRNTNPRTFP